ncbi:MAG: hypothetical protein WB816_18580 [Methylocystis sp.]
MNIQCLILTALLVPATPSLAQPEPYVYPELRARGISGAIPWGRGPRARR